MTNKAYHKSSTAHPFPIQPARRTCRPGEEIPPKGTLEPDAHGALARHCAGCGSRDRLNRSLAVELDRLSAENRALRGELERAA